MSIKLMILLRYQLVKGDAVAWNVWRPLADAQLHYCRTRRFIIAGRSVSLLPDRTCSFFIAGRSASLLPDVQLHYCRTGRTVSLPPDVQLHYCRTYSFVVARRETRLWPDVQRYSDILRIFLPSFFSSFMSSLCWIPLSFFLVLFASPFAPFSFFCSFFLSSLCSYYSLLYFQSSSFTRTLARTHARTHTHARARVLFYFCVQRLLSSNE